MIDIKKIARSKCAVRAAEKYGMTPEEYVKLAARVLSGRPATLPNRKNGKLGSVLFFTVKCVHINTENTWA